MKNLAEGLSKEELDKIGTQVVADYERDKESCQKYFDANRRYLKLASAIRKGKKMEPWEGAADIIMPILTIAAIQFWSRGFNQLTPADKIATFDRTGVEDIDKAMRREKHHNFQLKEQMKFWLDEQSLNILRTGLLGTSIKKTYYNEAYKRVESRLVGTEDLVMPFHATSMDECPRKTHKLYFTQNDLRIQAKHGVFLSVAKELGPGTEDSLPQEKDTDIQDRNAEGGDIERLVLEQHLLLYIKSVDKDKDEIAIPRVVTVDFETKKVLRIVDNGDKVPYEQRAWFTAYYFLPNPDSGVYGWGLGMLMEHTNETINGIINQITNAGTLCTTIGGFVNKRSALGKQGGPLTYKMGQFKEIDGSADDVRKNVYIHDFPQPSQAQFSVLDMLLGYSEKLASISDISTGEMPPRDVAATAILKLAEEGQKVYGTIYRGLHRSAKSEFQKIARLNDEHPDLEGYMDLLGDYTVRDIAEKVLVKRPLLALTGMGLKKLNNGELPIPYARKIAKTVLDDDFISGVDIIPASNPNVTARMEAVSKAQLLKQDVMSDPFRAQDRDIVWEVTNRLYTELGIEGLELINPKPKATEPQDKTPQTEEADFLKDLDSAVLPEQDHLAHLQSHDAFKQSWYFQKLTPHGKEILDAHEREHYAALYTSQSGLGGMGQGAGNPGAAEAFTQ